MREFEQKIIQLEQFASGLCITERAQTNKFVWALLFAFKCRVPSKSPRILAPMTIECVAEEVIAEQYGPLNKDKSKNNTRS